MNNIEIKNLPDGNSNVAANKGMALQFRLDHLDDPDLEYVEMMCTGILEGLFIYLGNKQMQMTKLGYLFLNNQSKLEN